MAASPTVAGDRLPPTADILVIGGGVIGLAIALEARRRYPDQTVTVVEKEPSLGCHASGRNSGVLHAGFYYHAESLKARMTREGNARLQGYCAERNLPIRRCGKLVVARHEREHGALDELLRRARANGVSLEAVTEAEARQIEPRVRTVGRALHSPHTATVEPRRVLDALAADARAAGVRVVLGARYAKRERAGLRTSQGTIAAGFVVNAAGLYADVIARDFGFAEHLAIVPFRGVYLESDDPGERLGTNVYPVPDLRQPFLGVHFTVAADGRVKIGPTATPGFWREHYHGVTNLRLREVGPVLRDEARLFLADASGFRRLAVQELRKLRKRRLLALAGELVSGLGGPGRWRWGMVGVRAQLVDRRGPTLEMDFRLEGDDRSLHVLNAVSPAFTCAMPFAELVVARMARPTGTPVYEPGPTLGERP